jgi:hypothetical protein
LEVQLATEGDHWERWECWPGETTLDLLL